VFTAPKVGQVGKAENKARFLLIELLCFQIDRNYHVAAVQKFAKTRTRSIARAVATIQTVGIGTQGMIARRKNMKSLSFISDG
jgi:hypothetical protein